MCRDVIESLPLGYAFLADQLRRSSSSIVLNFAEGYGKRSPRDARRYFDTSRGSANEVAATLDWAAVFGLLPEDTHRKALDLCDHLARMLTRFRR